jgi:hypothetical protein
VVLYADPSVVASRPRAVTPATSPLCSRGGGDPVGPRDACVVSDSERGADRIAAGGLLVWSRDRSFRRLVSVRVLLRRRSSVSVLVA